LKKIIFVLGGYGVTGRLIVELLLEQTDSRVIIAGRNLGKARLLAEDFNRQFPGERVDAVFADAADPASLDAALPGTSLAVIASSTSQWVLNTAQAVIKAGADYLDLQYSARKLQILKSLEAKINKTGACFITDGGFHPGLPSAMIRYLAPEFDRLEKAVVGSVIRLNWKHYPISASTAQEFIREFTELQSEVYRAGHWVTPPFWGMFEGFKMDYGEPFGKVSGFPMFVEELREIPKQYPMLQETGFYIAGFSFMVDWLIMPLVFLGLKLGRKNALKPMADLLFWGLNKFSVPPYETLLQLEAQGKKGGLEKKMRLRIFHPDGYRFTALATVATIKQYLSGESNETGLWLQGNLVNPQRLMDDLRQMGVGIVKEDF